jgi:imidazole glycerol-phosphate synthase subunit HisH
VSDVVVVDYGAGNTHSVRAALARLGRSSVVTSDPVAVRDAERVILPGVGSARSAMDHLRDTGAATALAERVLANGPVLGICLGLQLALESSEEDGGVVGLGLIAGDVTRLREGRVPRLGWEIVEPWGDAFYFAHSYAANTPYATASADGVTAAVEHGSFLGVQFHPEKSGPAGLDFLSACLSRA